MNEHLRLAAACRRLKFNVLESMGILAIISYISFLEIKEPWNKLYKRSLK